MQANTANSRTRKIARAAELMMVLAVTSLTVAIPASINWGAPTPENNKKETVAAHSSLMAGDGLNSKLDASTKARIAATYGKLPMSFEANQGQSDRAVKYLARGDGYSLFLTPGEAVLKLKKTAGAGRRGESAVLRMAVTGANPEAQMAGVNELPGRSSYFIGNDPSAWRTEVPSYAKVKCSEVYAGIDMVYHGNQRQMEYDFVVAPGARTEQIALAFEGADRVELDAKGDLVLHTQGGAIRQHKPVTYQELNGTRQEIASNYVMRGGNQVGFEIAAYDQSRELVIDPVLSYSTYMGGTGHDIAMGIALDASGSVFLTGETHSAKFPTNSALRGPRNSEGDYDNGFVTKLNATGNAIMFNAYVGGSDSDSGMSITIDQQGRPLVSGLTYSKDFPVTANALAISPNKTLGASAFVSQLAANGMGLSFSTYLGGNQTDYALGVAVDKTNNIFVTGRTESSDFPVIGKFKSTQKGKGDLFVAKINPEEGLVYSMTFGGSETDYGFGIAVDSYGSAIVVGKTNSSDFTTASAMQPAMAGGRSDAFIAKVDPEGSSLVFSTFLGGTGDDQALGVAVDLESNIFVTGSTSSLDFPTLNAMQPERSSGGPVGRDAFVTKLNAEGTEMIYSTFLGGTGDDLGQSIGVDRAGNAYICGMTSSADFPITSGAFQTTYAGSFDAFVTVLYPNGSPLLYSTYLGGKGEDAAVSMVVDDQGNAYIAGKTASLNFPTTRNPFQAKNAGGQDAFVAKIVPLNQ